MLQPRVDFVDNKYHKQNADLPFAAKGALEVPFVQCAHALLPSLPSIMSLESFLRAKDAMNENDIKVIAHRNPPLVTNVCDMCLCRAYVKSHAVDLMLRIDATTSVCTHNALWEARL